MTQTELGVELAAVLGDEVPQTTMSRWEKGLVELSVRQLQAVEVALSLPPGALFAAAGVVNLEKSAAEIEWLIRADPHLLPSVRNHFADAYVGMVTATREVSTPRLRRVRA
jgi:hypothetical protein